jgi:hypothetical protein
VQEVSWPEHIYENFFVVVSSLLLVRAGLLFDLSSSSSPAV